MDAKLPIRMMLQDAPLQGARLAVFDKSNVAECPLHWHEYIELELVTGGTGTQLLNGRETPLSRGALTLLRHTDFHRVLNPDKLSLINMGVDDRILPTDLLQRLVTQDSMFFHLTEEETQVLEQLLRLVLRETCEQIQDEAYVLHLISCILLRVLRLVPEQSMVAPVRERPIQTALLYLHMHFRENPPLKEVAKIAHYSVSHFSDRFHHELGITYSAYLNSLKINYAKELLLSTGLNITDICYECGFTSHSNFLRLFHEHTGLSPARFRKKIMESEAV